MKARYIIALAAGALALCCCQRESSMSEYATWSDGAVRYSPNVAAVPAGDIRSQLPGTSGKSGRTLVLTREDGYSVPMTCTVSSCGFVPTRGATLINEKGDLTGATFAKAVDSLFMVAAWDTPTGSDSTVFIPDAVTACVVNGYQKVMYRDSTSSGNYWMTVQPQTASVPGAPKLADDEYIWKDGRHKTFYAYANLPSSGASVSKLANGRGQELECTSVPVGSDILLGHYSGDGTVGGKKSGTAGIGFSHPLAAVRFKTGKIAYGVKVNGITIENVYTSGKATQKGSSISWTRADGSAFSASDATGSVSTSLTTDDADNTVLLIPQTFAAASKSRIRVNVTDGKGNTFNIYGSLDGTAWSADKVYTYTIDYLPPFDGDEEDFLPGYFSVSETEYVQFTKGNLYCTDKGDGAIPRYMFSLEDEQYQFHGRGGSRYFLEWMGATETTQSWLDKEFYNTQHCPPDLGIPVPGLLDKDDDSKSGLFQWNKANAVAGSDYGAFSTVSPDIDGSLDDKIDWGVAYGNGTTSMTANNWVYLIVIRGGGSLAKWSTVNGVAGLVLASDPAMGDYYSQVTIKDSYTVAEWHEAEIQFGLVFMPAVGMMLPSLYSDETRHKTTFYWVGVETTAKLYYWSADGVHTTSFSDWWPSVSDKIRMFGCVAYVSGGNLVAGLENAHNRSRCMPVRLVKKFSKN